MVGRGDVVNEGDVGGPGEVFGIARAPDHEPPRGRPPGRIDEQSLQRRLSIVGVRAQIGEIRERPG